MKVASEKDREEGRESQQSELSLPGCAAEAHLSHHGAQGVDPEKQHWPQLSAC